MWFITSCRLTKNAIIAIFIVSAIICHSLSISAFALDSNSSISVGLSQQPAAEQIQSLTPISSEAERVYAFARDKLIQVRTLVTDTKQQMSSGSGFFVEDGTLAVTNYHVVSNYALLPKTYKLEYATPDGKKGNAELVAIDVINDLALIRTDASPFKVFSFNQAAVSGNSLKGERFFSMGNPLNIGFAVVEGTNNGLVDRSYIDRIHFTGAINSGMSGGPAVTIDNQVVGVNVSKRVDNDLVSFLVPARFVVDLIQKTKSGNLVPIDAMRAEVTRQILEWQDGLYKTLSKTGFSSIKFSNYSAVKDNTEYTNCWSGTNSNDKPQPLAIQNNVACWLDAGVFLNDEVRTGSVVWSHIYTKSVSLNQFQFATFNRSYYTPFQFGNDKGKHFTQRFCHEDFVVQEGKPSGTPPLHVLWCGQGYRDFEGLYDISVLVMTQDNPLETLMSRLFMKGVSYPNAVSYATQFLGGQQ